MDVQNANNLINWIWGCKPKRWIISWEQRVFGNSECLKTLSSLKMGFCFEALKLGLFCFFSEAMTISLKAQLETKEVHLDLWLKIFQVIAACVCTPVNTEGNNVGTDRVLGLLWSSTNLLFVYLPAYKGAFMELNKQSIYLSVGIQIHSLII